MQRDDEISHLDAVSNIQRVIAPIILVMYCRRSDEK